jgi:hypothetical protein
VGGRGFSRRDDDGGTIEGPEFFLPRKYNTLIKLSMLRDNS